MEITEGRDVIHAFSESEHYRKEIVDIVDKIKDAELLKRIYNLAEYLYIHK